MTLERIIIFPYISNILSISGWLYLWACFSPHLFVRLNPDVRWSAWDEARLPSEGSGTSGCCQFDLQFKGAESFNSIDLSICLLIQWSIYLSMYLSIYLPNILPTYLPTYLPIYLPTYLPTYPSTYLPTCLLTYLPTYLLILLI